MSEPLLPQARDHWSSKTAFVFAAIGSAIGLGNVWRFPRICAENGGAAFLIAYVVALFSTGIPILILELAVGQKQQLGTPQCFASVKKRLEPLGWFIVGVGFIITIYYAVVMSWCANYFAFSFTRAWGDDPKAFFVKDFLGLLDLTTMPANWGSLLPGVLVGSIASWIFIKVCIWNGVKTVSKVVYLTVIVPWALLLVFVWRGMTLTGAERGLAYYLIPNWSQLLNYQTWLAAYAQVFFSLSIGFGIMFAYGSFMKPGTRVVRYAFIIGISDALTAMIGGLAVFSALGYLELQTGTPVDAWKNTSAGIAFIAYPIIINKLPGIGAIPGYLLFGPMFFLMLLTLAIDSAFSLVESVITALEDKFGWTYRETMLVVCYVSFVAGIPLATQAGPRWLDVTDYFMNSFGLVIACLIECIVFGYVYKARRIRQELQEGGRNRLGPWWEWMVLYVSPLVLAGLLGFEIVQRIRGPYFSASEDVPFNRATEFFGGWMILILLALAAVLLTAIRRRPKKQPAPAPAEAG